MSRSVVSALIALGLGSLSCQIWLPAPKANLPAPLASLAAPPPIEDAAPVRDAGEPVPEVGGPERSADELAREAAEMRVLAFLRSRHTALSQREIVELAETIVSEARQHEIDPELVLAVIQVESGGYNLAESHVGALGLMQVMPETGGYMARLLGLEWRGAGTLFDPIVNVKIGVAYLRQLSDRYQSVDIALAAYNWGPSRIDSRLRRGVALPSLYIEQVRKAYGVAAPPS